MNINTLEKTLTNVVSEWSKAKVKSKTYIVRNFKYTDIYTLTTDGGVKVLDQVEYDKYEYNEKADYEFDLVYKGTKNKASKEDEEKFHSSFCIEKLDTPKKDQTYFKIWKDKDGYKISVDGGLVGWDFLSHYSEFHSSNFEGIFESAFDKANLTCEDVDDATYLVYEQ